MLLTCWLLLFHLAAGVLEDVSVTGDVDILHVVSQEISEQASDGTIKLPPLGGEVCVMDPDSFWSDIHFYIIKCRHNVQTMQLQLHGTVIMPDGQSATDGKIHLELPHSQDSRLRTVYSCPDDVSDMSDSHCIKYQFDIYREGSEFATLRTLGVSSKKAMAVEPNFDSGITKYHAKVEKGTPFAISARASQSGAFVGIRAPAGAGLNEAQNGCSKASSKQEMWEISEGIKATGVFKFVICAVAPDKAHRTEYELEVMVTPQYSEFLKSISAGDFELVPPFDPNVQSYRIEIDASDMKVHLTAAAEDHQALISVEGANNPDAPTSQEGVWNSEIHMHDNSDIDVGESPQWSQDVMLQVRTADGERTMTYMVNIKQKVSTFSHLKNITVGETPCVLTPYFEPNVTEYQCTWWWEDEKGEEKKFGEIVPIVDEIKCGDCELLIPSDKEFPKSHLSLKFQEMKKRKWKSGKSWRRDFLYGEYHVIPLQVISADKFTHTTYNIALYRDSPWWMKAQTTRTISQWATIIATGMALSSAGNFMALAKQVQFMDLTTEIPHIPSVYGQFADNLRGFNFDVTQYLPSFGLPTYADVQEFRNHLIDEIQSKFAMGKLKDSSTLIMQYCYAKESFGLLEANSLLAWRKKHAEIMWAALKGDRKQLAEDERAAQEKAKEKATKAEKEAAEKTEKEEEVATSRLLQSYPELDMESLGGFGHAQLDVVSGGDNISNLRLRGARQLEGGPGDDVLRHVEEDDEISFDGHFPRRLEAFDATAVVQWPDRKWRALVKKYKEQGITVNSFEDKPTPPCDLPPMSTILPVLSFMHELELVRRMLHTPSGTFIIMVFTISIAGTAYLLYWKYIMQNSQKRLRMLEPAFLWIWILDYALIGFMKSAATLFTKELIVTFFFWKPERWQVQAFCIAGIIIYPVIFVAFMFVLTWTATKKVFKMSEDEAESDEQQAKMMVFNKKRDMWIDPYAKEIKVTLEPPIPKYIPVVGQVLTSHVRCCIPVLTPEGNPISFLNGQEKTAKAPLDEEKHREEEERLNRELQDEIDKLATVQNQGHKAAKLMRAKTEKEMLTLTKKRAESHVNRIEESRQRMEAEANKHKEAPDWMLAAGEAFAPVNLGEFAATWKSKKSRSDREQLEPEEQFAIQQFLEVKVRRERRLLKYHIMEIGCRNGRLLPKEPFTDDNKWWLGNQELQNEADKLFDLFSAAGLQEYGFHKGKWNQYIENAKGERLVYKGDSSYFGLGWFKTGTEKAGDVIWLQEPDEGWDDWAKKHPADGTGKDGMRYADKWQWFFFDHEHLPWRSDDDSEKEFRLLGGCLTVKKEDIPLYALVTKAIGKRTKQRVPRKITLDEKNEIRKFIWSELIEYMELKLKLGFVASHHAKFYKGQTLETIAKVTFSSLLLDVEHAVPHPDMLLPDELHHNPEEHKLYTIMKLEDLYENNEEPWWDECDQPGPGEEKVMLDHDMFFMSGNDPAFKRRRDFNKLIPEHGYCTSSVFHRHQNDKFGFKRYVLKKPDDPVNSVTRVTLSLQMKHVLPLMRYTSGFKVSVPIDSLDMQYMSMMSIILADGGKGEEYNVPVDRMTTLLSIYVLTSSPNGPYMCTAFLIIKLITFANLFYSKYTAGQEALEAVEQQEKAKADAEGEKQPLLQKAKPVPAPGGKKKKKRPATLLAAFLEVDVLNIFLQCVTLGLLDLSQFGMMPPPLCAIFCIFVCATSMIYMNVKTFVPELEKLIEALSTSIGEAVTTTTVYYIQARNWLNGENFMGFVFLSYEQRNIAFGEELVSDVTFVIPDLGLSIKGKADVDDTLPADEKRRQQLQKRITHWVHQKRDDEFDDRISSIMDHPRFEQDIQRSFAVALSVDQLKLCEGIPPIVATLQCVNHSMSDVSRPEFDTYKTLFLPEEWEPDYDLQNDKVDALLDMWRAQVKEWMRNTLGAVDSDKTCTKQIEDQIASLLELPFKGSILRECVMVKIENILIPDMTPKSNIQLRDLEGHMVFCTVLYEREDPQTHHPRERASPIGQIVKYDASKITVFNEKLQEEGDDDMAEADLSTVRYMVQTTGEFKVAKPADVNKMKLALWVQYVDGSGKNVEAMLGISKEFDLSFNDKHNDENDADEQRLLWFTCWDVDRRKGCVPIQEEEHIPADQQTCWRRFKTSISRLFRSPVTKDDVLKAQGAVDLSVRLLSKREKERDKQLMLAMQDMVEGTSEMNLEKLKRHKDRKLAMAEHLRMRVDNSTLNEAKEHLNKLKKIRGDIMIPKYLSSPATLENKLVNDYEVRRSLAKPEAMDAAIEELENQIQKLEDPHLQQAAAIKAHTDKIPPNQVEVKIIGHRIFHLDPGDFDQELMRILRKFKEDSGKAEKLILHYVMLSEHLKPSKVWRPDAISNHIGDLVLHEFEDVAEVRLACDEFPAGAKFPEKGIDFKRMTLENSERPASVNSRLVFKAQIGDEVEVWKNRDVFLYWDGHTRWVISPYRAEPAPYGLSTDKDLHNQFLWAQDNAITPDNIVAPWHVYIEGKWMPDTHARVHPKRGVTVKRGAKTKAAKLAENAMQMNDASASQASTRGILGEICHAVSMLLVGTSSTKAPPELRPCLLGLEGNKVQISWKDRQMEDLAHLRVFMLNEFGSYQSCWAHLCRQSSISKSLFIRNIIKLLERAAVELDEAEKVEKDKASSTAEQDLKEVLAEKAALNKQKSPAAHDEDEKAAETSLLSKLHGQAQRSIAKLGFGRTEASVMEAKKKAVHTTITSQDLNEDNKSKMHEYLSSIANDRDEVCYHIASTLDVTKDERIMVEEIMHLYTGSTHTDDKVAAFQTFCKNHPHYVHMENLWADLSEDLEISLDEFKESAKFLLMRFNHLQRSDMTPEEKAQWVFSKFDVNMSKAISLPELVPPTGPSVEDAHRSLVSFDIPLDNIKEIRLEPAKQSREGQIIRIHINPQFEKTRSWVGLKKAMNPDWEPSPGFESVQIAVPDVYAQMWKQVIRDCGMESHQEWIRFYDGATADHGSLNGAYVRSGLGIQRWPDGKTYSGNWQNHVYWGSGKLYNSYEEFTNNQQPIFNGSWERGKRHGFGVMRWEQDVADRERKPFNDRQYAGVTKVYEGFFKNDLFHGRGKMYLDRAIAQSLPGRTLTVDSIMPGVVPLPNLDPAQILSFEGHWEADWAATDKLVREQNITYKLSHPNPILDLNLEKVSTKDKKRRKDLFSRYFQSDDQQIQTAGAQLPDLALACYQSRGGEAIHMRVGQAKYADLTEYDGSFKDGMIHGQGSMVQYEQRSGMKGNWLAKYTGEWQASKFHGEGKYETIDGLTYEGQWGGNTRHGKGFQTVSDELSNELGYNRYEGEFFNDVFEGFGRLVIAKGLYVYEGQFIGGKRDGKGTIYENKQEGDRRKILDCKWTRDQASTSVDEPAWVYLEPDRSRKNAKGRFFYGLITKDGRLGNFGTLFSEQAAFDPEFMRCFVSGQKYEAEDASLTMDKERSKLKFTVYHGGWKDGLPHGFGVQHFQSGKNGAHGGIYVGEFEKGKRHGRGSWTHTKSGWTYGPIQQEGVPNWENDHMHGIAIVEDSSHVHENVIYTHNACQMPFTEGGPPKTGFDSALGTGKKDFMPLPTLAVDYDLGITSSLSEVFSKEDMPTGWDPDIELKSLHKIAQAFAKMDRFTTNAKRNFGGTLKNPLALTNQASTVGTAAVEVSALVREPTDLTLPEEDVIISGGTGDNEVMNGVYFKLTQTFGVKAFKMVKQHGFYKEAVTRYLYRDTATNAWVITGKPFTNFQIKPGCAMTHDDVAEHPSQVSTPWYVWYGWNDSLQTVGAEAHLEAEKENAPALEKMMRGPPPAVDKLECTSMVGFEVKGTPEKMGKVLKGVMLRTPFTVYGRPAFEAETGGQYLFFMKQGGDLTEGSNPIFEEFGSGVDPNPAALYDIQGFWLVADDLTVTTIESPKCFAYCEDYAVTPDQIKRAWYVRRADGSWDTSLIMDNLSFEPQQWKQETTSMRR